MVENHIIKEFSDRGKVFVHGLGQTPENWDAVLLFINETEKCVS